MGERTYLRWRGDSASVFHVEVITERPPAFVLQVFACGTDTKASAITINNIIKPELKKGKLHMVDEL